MGVRRKDYIILGVDIGYETFKDAQEYLDEETFIEMESYIHSDVSGKMTIIPQWEDERGCYVGYLIARSDEYAGFENAYKVGLGDYSEREEIVDFVANMFDETIEPDDVKVIVFTVWS